MEQIVARNKQILHDAVEDGLQVIETKIESSGIGNLVKENEFAKTALPALRVANSFVADTLDDAGEVSRVGIQNANKAIKDTALIVEDCYIESKLKDVIGGAGSFVADTLNEAEEVSMVGIQRANKAIKDTALTVEDYYTESKLNDVIVDANSLVTDRLGDAEEVSMAGIQRANKAIKDTALTVEDIYNESTLKDVIGDSFDGLDEACTQSREALQMALKAVAGVSVAGCTAGFPLMRVEILRDFMQTVSLFFTNLYAVTIDSPWVEGARGFYGGVANLFTVDVAAALQSDELVTVGLIVLMVAVGVAYTFYLWFIFHAVNGHSREKELREGHETQTWSEIESAKRKTVKVTTIAITICLSIYLPVAKTCLELISEKKDAFLVKQLSSDQFLVGQCFSYFLLTTFTLPLPFVLFHLVQTNKPAGNPENPDIVYDVDGEQVPFDDKIYHHLIEHDPNQQKCPYRSLYQGFERRWAYYKVLQLLSKLLLAIPLILLVEEAKVWASVLIYTTLTGVSFYLTPFIDSVNDIMDSSGRVTGVITAFGGALLIAFPGSNSFGQIVGVVVTLVNTINYCIMAGAFLNGNKKVRAKLKNIRGSFSFSDTVKGIEQSSAHKIVPCWDLDREVKHRIWYGKC